MNIINNFANWNWTYICYLYKRKGGRILLIGVWAPVSQTSLLGPRWNKAGKKKRGLPQRWHHHPVMSWNVCRPKIQTHTDSETNRGSRHRNNTSHTRSSVPTRKKHLERRTKELIGFNSIVSLTFPGCSACPIRVWNASLEWGPSCNPWDFSQSSQMSLSVFLWAKKPYIQVGSTSFSLL